MYKSGDRLSRASIVLCGYRSQSLSPVVLPFLAGGFYLIAQNDHLSSSHHVQIPARRKEGSGRGVRPLSLRILPLRIAYIVYRTTSDGHVLSSKAAFIMKERCGGKSAVFAMVYERLLWPRKCFKYKTNLCKSPWDNLTYIIPFAKCLLTAYWRRGPRTGAPYTSSYIS